MKSCFLYLGLFPRAFHIPVRRLLHQWVAKGLVAPSPNDEKNIALEDVAEKYFKELVRRNMIEVTRRRADGSPKTCRVLHRLYDFVDRIRKLNQDFRKHRVVDQEGVNKPKPPESPGNMMIFLKYLGLRRTFIDKLPLSIVNLPYLETLDVKHTRITTLESSIWNAKNLRHLYMNNIHFHIPVEDKTTTGSLANLQTLKGLFIGDKSLVEDWLMIKCTGLRKLGLTFHLKSAEAICNWVSQLTNLQSLKLRSCDEFGRPSDLDKLGTLGEHKQLTDLYLLGKLPQRVIQEDRQLPKNLKILTLSGSQLKEDPMPVLGKLPQLNILRFFGFSYLGTTMKCLPNECPQLRVLKLWMLENLEEWNVEKGAMPRLRELEIRYCKALEVVTGLQEVTTLKDIILTNMEMDFVADAVQFMKMDVSIVKVNQRKFAPLRVKWSPTPKHDAPKN